MKLNRQALIAILCHIEENVPFTDGYETIELGDIDTDCSPDDLDYAFHVLKTEKMIDGSITRPIGNARCMEEGSSPRYFIRSIGLAGHDYLDKWRDTYVRSDTAGSRAARPFKPDDRVIPFVPREEVPGNGAP